MSSVWWVLKFNAGVPASNKTPSTSFCGCFVLREYKMQLIYPFIDFLWFFSICTIYLKISYKICYNTIHFCVSFNKCSCFTIAVLVTPSNIHILCCNSTQCPPTATTHCPSPSNLSSLALRLDEWCLPPSKAETTVRMWECGEEGMTVGLQASLMQLPPRVSLLFFCFL